MAVAEGQTFPFDPPEKIGNHFLETFDFDSKDQYILTETDEFSAVCPFSGLPDYGTLIIEYYPKGGKCVELKSLKYYMTSYRNVGLFQEGVTKRIHADLKALLETDEIMITTIYKPRGGFYTTCIEGNIQKKGE